MEIAVIGTGYVGLVTGACLSEVGNRVTCIDIDEEKVATLKQGISPIYEEGLEALLRKNISESRLDFTTDYKEGLAGKDIVYIAVGTPQNDDGSADLTAVAAVCRALSKHLVQDVIIVTKSTVPVGTNEYIKGLIEENLLSDATISIASNPEFLRQGSAVYDTFNGDRIVIGSDSPEVLDVLETVNEGFGLPMVRTNLRSAEMIKYASNAFLATKISFINEMANLSERIGANIDDVSRGMGMDQRIGEAFLNAGIGYGGSCFPKDTRAIISVAREAEYDMQILENVVDSNERQRGIIVEKVMDRFDSISGRKVAVLGLAFKPNTDDVRAAPSISVIEKLIGEGAEVHTFDPAAMENARKVLPEGIHYRDNIEDAVRDAEIAIILTEWKEIKSFPIEKYESLMETPVVFDGRNCFTLEGVGKTGVEYHSIGRPSIGN
ncbi:UDP-glucose dehydrogenase family protein [Lacicoccus alkaliphilus]|uniref:UDP-glucose 6-dehydrogenase n=1 Tax=Lacicoccus alkaliphilus DSM 16010 TaxID=1123231 RepID=A0A1M7H532_9BACL|nr:UDP-glucose/GDP-mannose dehydrogenase family protein [Salinicoccus alkaliphilus]SHM23685.1 UDPglucose 6-dehydrogenase [Salinicoccus alkaliphilus DSM 16010]